MNIEIANRLVNLRKSNGLSQEALAEKLGISRQAVSKWERAEASPDTDNLIMLARLYKVSLDELLQTEDEIPVPEREEVGEAGDSENALLLETAGDGRWEKDSETDKGNEPENAAEGEGKEEKKEEYVHVGFEGVHVKDKDGSEVHVGWDGIHVDDREKGNNVHIDKDGVYVNGKKYEGDWLAGYRRFPVASLIVILYLFMGFVFWAWHPAWLLFLLIPLWESFLDAVRRKNPHIFAYPVLATLLFLCLGIFFGAWHPGWVVFLTVPVYYPLVSYLTGRGKNDEADI